ncbi:unnamed protein product [Tilletia controversa]|nr:unnamed protein product [Tilletia controversa]
MISFIKKQGPKFALLLLASQLLTAVAASPFDLDSRALVSRARGGKYVGSSCQVDSECYSASCATGDDGVTRTCQRQLPGGPCFENSNCDTRQCDLSAGICKASAVNGLCTNYYDCDGWEQGTVTCQNKKCKIQDSKACTQSNQCASGFCNNKICRRRPQAPNSPCFVDGECLSGDCAAITASQCTNPDGSFAYCPGTTDQHCTRYALGHSCANNGECQEGFCRSGKCVASKDGDACSEQYQCTGPSVCGNGKCYTPSNATLHPNDVCDIGSQCLSGRCVTDQLQKDSYGVNTVTLKNQYPARCDYLANGQTSCRSFTDCSTGLCQSGTCNLGKDGDRCQVNYQCENLCSSDGVCYTPAKSNAQGQGEPCKTDDQCLSRSSTRAVEDPSLVKDAVLMATAAKAHARTAPARSFLWEPPPSRASETSTPPEDPENDPGNILRRLAETPEAMASIMKLMTVIKEEGGIDIGQAVREDGSVDPNAMGKRPSMFEMARMMMNGKIRDAVKEVHAELMKAGIELTPERVSAILQADELIRGLKK